jgi:hypothetical protein
VPCPLGMILASEIPLQDPDHNGLA